MAKKRKGHEMTIYRGTAGSTAATLITPNVVDIDPGGGQFNYVNLPTRGNGTGLPQMDECPTERTSQPTFSMIYFDGDAHFADLVAAADADPPEARAIMIERIVSGEVAFDGDCFISYSSPGPIADGQTVEFELHPNGALRGFVTT